ncbi:MAG: phytoene/squalene synthase family protein [Chthoniobacterales bacterium]
MNSSSSIPINRLRGALLRDVSRSFYLSLRLLPTTLRDPISLAYLLARATDTIADTAAAPVEIRLERLRELARQIQSGGAQAGAASFASLATDPAERLLLENVPACLTWLQEMPDPDQCDIRKVLARINEGQVLDLQRFGDAETLAALETAADLDRYTYLVAGCVGEFWTRVCFRRLTNFSAETAETMLSWGVEYGKGLQLINILRDAGADLGAGRCYLPGEELRSLGLSVDDLGREPARAEPVLRSWRERAEQGIAAGVDYACAIKSARVRMATVLPALIGARTLALLRQAGAEVFARRIKIERAEVRQILFTLATRLASRRSIRELFARLSS